MLTLNPKTSHNSLIKKPLNAMVSISQIPLSKYTLKLIWIKINMFNLVASPDKNTSSYMKIKEKKFQTINTMNKLLLEPHKLLKIMKISNEQTLNSR